MSVLQPRHIEPELRALLEQLIAKIGTALEVPPVRFVLLTDGSGNDLAVNPEDVSRVQRRNATESTVRYKSGGSDRVQGTVESVSLALASA